MSKEIKLKTGIAVSQDGANKWKNLLTNYNKFFTKDQGAFQGRKNTYQPVDESVDDPSKRGYTKVITTVDEKLQYMEATLTDYLNVLFSVEATNASGTATAELIVDGTSWGKFSSLELMRLKTIIDNGDFKQTIANIPVRSDAEIWNKSSADEYTDRQVYEKALVTVTNKTIAKEQYILDDPNIIKNPGLKYEPKIATKDTAITLGTGTMQEFTGMWSQTQKAKVLHKLDVLKSAITRALDEANDVPMVQSDIKGDTLFNYLFK